MLTERSERVRQARRLTRRAGREKAGLFLAEGAQAVREAAGAGRDRAVDIFVTPATEERHRDIVDDAVRAGIDVHVADDAALAGLSETVTPQGIVAVCRSLLVSLDDAVPVPDGATPADRDAATGPGVAARGPARRQLVAALVDVRDPGNAGTVIRCADAAGATSVVLTKGSVDPQGGKAVRASAGSLFHLPIATGAPAEEVVGRLHAAGLAVLAADGDADMDLDEAEDDGLLARPAGWLFGNEAWGMPENVRALADHVIRVPIHGRAESLNLAAAAAVCLYASARAQRRAG